MKKYGKKTLGDKIRAYQFQKAIKKIWKLCTYDNQPCKKCQYGFHAETNDGEVYYECGLVKWQNGCERYPYEYNEL